jgi:hypothetical protein
MRNNYTKKTEEIIMICSWIFCEFVYVFFKFIATIAVVGIGIVTLIMLFVYILMKIIEHNWY